MKKKYKIDLSFYDEKILQKTVELFSDVANIKYEDSQLIIEGKNENEIGEIYKEFLNFYIYVFNTEI